MQTVLRAETRCGRCGAEIRLGSRGHICEACLLAAATAEPPEDASQPVRLDDLAGPVDALPRLPGYEILGVIGRGGMGMVYRARQTSLGRVVALKMLLTGGLAAGPDRLRFAQEAKAAAALRHPGIVPVYDSGEHEGHAYFTMEWVPGVDLVRWAEGRPVLPAQAARCVREVAEALHYAHTQCVLHRDLKPSNVLVDQDGRCRLTDFGLAKPANLEGTLTKDGQVLGTPGYAPPEQLGAGRGRIGPWSDVYGVGGILYFLLTGRPPFQASTLADTLQQVLNETPPGPRALNASVPPALEAICLRCLEKVPADRYVTAAALAEDLDRFLAGEVVEAARMPVWRRGWRRMRRHPWTSAVQAVFAAALLLTALWAHHSARRAEAIARTAEASRQAANEAAALAQAALEAEGIRIRRELYASRIAGAHLAWQQGNVGQAWEMWNVSRPEEPGWEYFYLESLFTAGHRALRVHSGALYTVAFSPDGRRLASGGADRIIRIWDPADGNLIRTFPLGPRQVWMVTWLPDSRRVLSMDSTGTLMLWDAESGRALGNRPPSRGAVVAVALAPDGSRVAVVTDNAATQCLDVPSFDPGKPLEQAPAPVTGLAFDRSGRRIAGTCRDGTWVIWDADSGRHLCTGGIGDGRQSVLAFHPTRNLLASGGREGVVSLWDADSGELLSRLETGGGALRGLAFSPDGSTLATAGVDLTVRLWTSLDKPAPTLLRGHLRPPQDLVFSPDGRLLASAGRDGAVRLWSLPPDPLPRRLRVHDRAVKWLAVSADGDTFVSVSRDNQVSVGFPRNPGRLRELIRHEANVTVAGISPDGRRVVLGTAHGGGEAWDLALGRPLRQWREGGIHRCVAWSGDGQFMALGGEGGTVWIRDRDLTEVGPPLTGLGRPVQQIAFSRDGQRLLTVGRDGTLRTWNVTTREEQVGARTLRADLIALADGAGGPLIAMQGADARLRIESLGTNAWVVEAEGQDLPKLTGTTFSADGRRLFGVGERTLFVWETATGHRLMTLNQDQALWFQLAVTPDQRCLLLGDGTGAVVVYDSGPGPRMLP